MKQLQYWSNFRDIFPYEDIRTNQFELIEKILSASDGSRIILEAPTGIGKSIASLASCLTRLEKDHQLLIFTRTINQMEPFLREWSRIILNSPINPREMLILPVIGKSRLCRILKQVNKKSDRRYRPHDLCRSLPVDLEVEVSPDLPVFEAKTGNPCPFYPFGNRGRELKKLNREADLAFSIGEFLPVKGYTTGNLREFIEKTGQCAYYGLRSVLRHAQILILPHHYLDRKNYPKIADNLEPDMEHSLVIIDEAHHLLEYNITKITEAQMDRAVKILGQIPWLVHFQKTMKNLSGNILVDKLFPDGLQSHSRYVHTLKILRASAENSIVDRDLLYDPVFDILQEIIDNRLHGVFDKKLDTLRLVEFSPQPRLSVVENAQLVIFQSATFHQLDLIKTAFQMPDAITHATSVNRSDQEFRAMFHSILTSKYERRTPKLYRKMAEMIVDLHQTHDRHSFVFFPSYEFLEEVRTELGKLLSDVEIIAETSDRSESELNSQILAADHAVILGNAIGKIAEGNEWVVDGKSLVKLVIMAGLPYIAIDPEDQHWLELYRRREFHTGELPVSPDIFTQLLPLLIRIEQCYGRAIRSEEDKAALVVLDYRAQKYRRELGLRYYRNSDKLYYDLSSFLS